MLSMLANLFPDAKKICSFHRGVGATDSYTAQADERRNRKTETIAKDHGFEILDLAFSPDKLSVYDDCDLHVGYRVHGHLYFLSRRKPSLLLEEDGRGYSLSRSLNHHGIQAFETTPLSAVTQRILPASIRWHFPRTCGIQASQDAVCMTKRFLQTAIENDFSSFAGVSSVIDATYPQMKRFLSSLP